MSKSSFKWPLMAIALIVVAGSTAQAQSAIDEIVVEAPRSKAMPRGERSPYGGDSVVITTVKIPVFYDDLDLKDPASVSSLFRRIEYVAKDVCAALDRMLPLDPDSSCFQTTVARARPLALAAVEASRK